MRLVIKANLIQLFFFCNFFFGQSFSWGRISGNKKGRIKKSRKKEVENLRRNKQTKKNGKIKKNRWIEN